MRGSQHSVWRIQRLLMMTPSRSTNIKLRCQVPSADPLRYWVIARAGLQLLKISTPTAFMGIQPMVPGIYPSWIPPPLLVPSTQPHMKNLILPPHMWFKLAALADTITAVPLTRPLSVPSTLLIPWSSPSLPLVPGPGLSHKEPLGIGPKHAPGFRACGRHQCHYCH